MSPFESICTRESGEAAYAAKVSFEVGGGRIWVELIKFCAIGAESVLVKSPGSVQWVTT